MADLSGFDASQVAPASFDVLPAGEYEVVIVASTMETTADGTGQFLKIELQVLSGEYQNRKLWDRLNLVNKSEKAVQIARGSLSAICRAVGVLTPRDSSELHNKPMRIKVKVEKSEDYGEQNRITAYKPRNAGPVNTPYSQPAPQQQTPPPTANTMPW